MEAETVIMLWVTTIFWLEFFYQQHLANIEARRKWKKGHGGKD